ncbi:hypothetical protein ACFVMC_11765 [Nocardia sp. NPDC127579]|uniref:hypothetical protein n=1 Tax=Nocardia sp. NPDC127579 TaxID=3345402 RepID=UPI003628B677
MSGSEKSEAQRLAEVEKLLAFRDRIDNQAFDELQKKLLSLYRQLEEGDSRPTLRAVIREVQAAISVIVRRSDSLRQYNWEVDA